MAWNVPDPTSWVKKPARKGPDNKETCAALPQQLAKMPLTEDWRPGTRVKDIKTLQKGTVIAIFDKNGHYTNEQGTAHAALYVDQTEKGIHVVNQNQKKGVITATFIPFGGRRVTQKIVNGVYDLGKNVAGKALFWKVDPDHDDYHHWGVSGHLNQPEDDGDNYYVVERRQPGQ